MSVSLDRGATAPVARDVVVDGVRLVVIPEGDPRYLAAAFAPMLYARPDALDRFSDVPLLLWYEVDPLPSGQRIRYSVVFSNEDGGTPADRLMATWGRLTDIEFVYGVELDAAGRVVARALPGQGPQASFPSAGIASAAIPCCGWSPRTTCSPRPARAGIGSPPRRSRSISPRCRARR